ncbi:hypothetical protein [Paractinoplanes durhamensis]|uniref:hypothetical protein n=1 Tax=Paractinoplanes durhamensis TaxID=113563 RepID=UPI00363EA9B5
MGDASFARTRGEVFEYAGATVELVDAATVLAAARVNPVELLRHSVWPAPVRRVDLTVSSADRADGAVHVFAASVSTADEPLSKERIRKLVLGNDPVGLLLAKRIEQGTRSPRDSSTGSGPRLPRRTASSVLTNRRSRRGTAARKPSPMPWWGCRRA